MTRPPLVVAWEVTRACPLACRHCRATAQHVPHPAELSHEEGLAFIDDLARTYPGAVLILTGSNAPDDVDRARSAGAAGYVTKDRIAAELVAAIFEAAGC